MAAATGTGAFAVDFAEYLVGTWKRNLEWRNFGGAFEHMRSSNTIVVVRDSPVRMSVAVQLCNTFGWAWCACGVVKVTLLLVWCLRVIGPPPLRPGRSKTRAAAPQEAARACGEWSERVCDDFVSVDMSAVCAT